MASGDSELISANIDDDHPVETNAHATELLRSILYLPDDAVDPGLPSFSSASDASEASSDAFFGIPSGVHVDSGFPTDDLIPDEMSEKPESFIFRIYLGCGMDAWSICNREDVDFSATPHRVPRGWTRAVAAHT